MPIKTPSLPLTISTLVLVLAGIGIWNEGNKDSFVVPSEHNLQTNLLQAYDATLALEDAANYEWKETGSVDKKTLHALAVSLLQNWTETPPEYVTDGDARYTLEDTFGLLANALRYYNQRGILPRSLPLIALIGPAQSITVDHGLEMNWEEILNGVDTLEIAPSTSIPSTITLPSVTLTAAEMLHGMAQIYLMIEGQLRSGEVLPSLIYIVPTSNF